MNVHFIAIGGSAMHALALALYNNDYAVSGSDDEIYDPAKSKLEAVGLLPDKMGWYPERIHEKLDFVILGMHAKPDNPELKKAQDLGLEILSYPSFIARVAADKQRVVIGGSHGKTTTTAIILHVLKTAGINMDYLVGAQLAGFDSMVKISDAPLIVLEGDEYLSSPLDRQPKFLHYNPNVAVLTGIAWDHINVFPTFGDYCSQFEKFVNTIEHEGTLIYFAEDENLKKIATSRADIELVPYTGFNFKADGSYSIVSWQNNTYRVALMGAHNMQNLRAAFEVCLRCGVEPDLFFEAIMTFKGASKRLELLMESIQTSVYLDFAHAPSKVKATIAGLSAQFPDRRIYAVLELHTYSSLNKNFLPQYQGSLNKAYKALVCYNKHTLEMKRLPDLQDSELKDIFSDNVSFGSPDDIEAWLSAQDLKNSILLFMSSGSFGRFNVMDYAQSLKEKMDNQ